MTKQMCTWQQRYLKSIYWDNHLQNSRVKKWGLCQAIVDISVLPRESAGKFELSLLWPEWGTWNGETESSQNNFAGALMPEFPTSKTLRNALLLIIDHLEDCRFFFKVPRWTTIESYRKVKCVTKSKQGSEIIYRMSSHVLSSKQDKCPERLITLPCMVPSSW